MINKKQIHHKGFILLYLVMINIILLIYPKEFSLWINITLKLLLI